MKLARVFLVLTFCLSFQLKAAELPILSASMDKQAWRDFARIGSGYYPIPEELKAYLAPTAELAKSVSWKGQHGYLEEAKLQVEILFLGKNEWDLYPEETALLAHGMNDVAASIVVNVLQAMDVDPGLYCEATGALSQGEGKSYFKLSHYDASKDLPGIPWHKDIRWVTVLFINQEGLQGRVGEEVIAINPKEGYFVVNLGVFFEAFINDKERLYAFEHQVEQVKKDRISFGIFCGGNYPEEGFYQLEGRGIAWKKPEEMKKYLLEDKSQAFTIGPHKLFEETSTKDAE